MNGPPVVRPPEALYLHVPFCVSLCPYCDFVVIAGSAARGPRSRIGQFLDALLVELDLRADALDAAFGTSGSAGRPPLRSVYLGGGTPSLLPPDEVARILGRVRERFGTTADAEVTLEANPGRTSVAIRRRSAAPASPGSRSAPSPSMTPSCASSAVDTGRTTSSTPSQPSARRASTP